MRGTLWFVQKIYTSPAGNGLYTSFEPEAFLPPLYEYAKNRLDATLQRPMFVTIGNRAASMLFDGDANSTVEFFPAGPIPNVCTQRVSLANVGYSGGNKETLGNVQGKWSGTIYLRQFTAPKNKPYVFLGRSRVLIQASSKLAAHFRNLKDDGRLIQLAETISLLKEDEDGFPSEKLASLL
jgi:hypothetical protein